jgi:hypothetical protein
MENFDSKKEKGPDHENLGGHGQNNRITVSIRYQEVVEAVEINVNASVTALLEAAMKATDNQSVPKERFQLKIGGVVLDPQKKVSDYDIKNGTTLILVLVAGGGGHGH